MSAPESASASMLTLLGCRFVVFEGVLLVVKGVSLPEEVDIINGVLMPDGVQVVKGVLIPEDVDVIDGVLLPDGVDVVKGVLMPKDVDVIDGVLLPDGMDVIKGVLLPEDVDIANGVLMAEDVEVVKGVLLPEDIKVEAVLVLDSVGVKGVLLVIEGVLLPEGVGKDFPWTFCFSICSFCFWIAVSQTAWSLSTSECELS